MAYGRKEHNIYSKGERRSLFTITYEILIVSHRTKEIHFKHHSQKNPGKGKVLQIIC